MRSKVYVLQEPVRKDERTGEMVSIMDFRKVLTYGEPVVCLPNGRVSLAPGPTVDKLKDVLRNFTDDDYVVSVGDPSAMFIAAMVIGSLNRQRCKLLKWDKDAREYIMVQIDLNHHLKKEDKQNG